MAETYTMGAPDTLQSKPSMGAASASSSLTTRSRFSKRVSRPKLTEAEEAELISRATMQAVNASRSIILSGGTQASALSTAQAAARSVLLPKNSMPGTPSMAQKKRYGRKKCKRQAQLIASMALSSVNSSLQSPNKFNNAEQLQQQDVATFLMNGPGGSKTLISVDDYANNSGKIQPSQPMNGLSPFQTPVSATAFKTSTSETSSLTNNAYSPQSAQKSSFSFNAEKSLSPISEFLNSESKPERTLSDGSEVSVDYFRKKLAREEEQNQKSPEPSLASAPKTTLPSDLPRSRASKIISNLSFEKSTVVDVSLDHPQTNAETLETGPSVNSSYTDSTGSQEESFDGPSSCGSTDIDTVDSATNDLSTMYTGNEETIDDTKNLATVQYQEEIPWLSVSDIFSCLGHDLEDRNTTEVSVGDAPQGSYSKRDAPPVAIVKELSNDSGTYNDANENGIIETESGFTNIVFRALSEATSGVTTGVCATPPPKLRGLTTTARRPTLANPKAVPRSPTSTFARTKTTAKARSFSGRFSPEPISLKMSKPDTPADTAVQTNMESELSAMSSTSSIQDDSVSVTSDHNRKKSLFSWARNRKKNRKRAE